ncbi:MAG: hypothetical protein ABII90_03565 [Bacteroidota bacterium]
MRKKNKNQIKTYMILVAIILVTTIIGIGTLGQALGIFSIPMFPEKAVTHSPYAKDVYMIQLFKDGDNVGFSLITEGIGIPNYGRTDSYELRSLNGDIVLQSVKFGFSDVIMVELSPECITDEGILITDTDECQSFDSMIEKEFSSIILNLEFSEEITEFQVLKDGEILAVRKLVEEPVLGQDPFTEIMEPSQTGIIDSEAQKLFETGSLETPTSIV